MESAISMYGESIKVGDLIGFNTDSDQGGQVYSIKNGILSITVYDPTTFLWENYDISRPAIQCWLEKNEI